MKKDSNAIALFDFDGTITFTDTQADFIRFTTEQRVFYLGILRLAPILITAALGLYSRDRAKEKVLEYFFKGLSMTTFEKWAEFYAKEKLDRLVRPLARERFDWHRRQRHKIVVVSASLENWLRPWCELQGFDLLATRLEIDAGKITGKLQTQNCNGMEKVNRLRANYRLDEYQRIYAYGNSKGDKEMLELAHERYYRPFE